MDTPHQEQLHIKSGGHVSDATTVTGADAVPESTEQSTPSIAISPQDTASVLLILIGLVLGFITSGFRWGWLLAGFMLGIALVLLGVLVGFNSDGESS